MILKHISPLIIIAFGLSLLINTLMVFALSKASLFGIISIASFITASISEDEGYHQKTDDATDVSNDTIDSDNLPIQNLSGDDANNSLSGEEDSGLSFPETIEKTELSSDIRLEVPSLHEGLLKRAALYDEKASESNSMVLLKHNRESLHYDLYWVGVYVGRAQLSAERTLTDLTISSEVHSAQFISNFYKVEDYAKSIVLGGRPHKFRIKQIEGKYRSDKETFFDYDKGLITFVDYLKNKQTEHHVKKEIYWDVISGFYYLRSVPVIDAEKIFVDVFDSNKFIKVQVVILGRETIELRTGREAETIKAKVIMKSEGLFQKVGDITIWLSDDADRIPLRVETKAPVGKVTAELKEMRIQ